MILTCLFGLWVLQIQNNENWHSHFPEFHSYSNLWSKFGRPLLLFRFFVSLWSKHYRNTAIKIISLLYHIFWHFICSFPYSLLLLFHSFLPSFLHVLWRLIIFHIYINPSNLSFKSMQMIQKLIYTSKILDSNFLFTHFLPLILILFLLELHEKNIGVNVLSNTGRCILNLLSNTVINREINHFVFFYDSSPFPFSLLKLNPWYNPGRKYITV